MSLVIIVRLGGAVLDMDLSELCVALSRGAILHFGVRGSNGSSVVLTAGSQRTALGDMSWCAIGPRADVIFRGRDAFELADWMMGSQRSIVDLDCAPIIDTRADDQEAERLEAFESRTIFAYDAFYDFRRSGAA